MLDYSIGDSPDNEEFTADIWVGEITFATIRYLEGKTLIGRFANTLSHFVLSLHCKPPVVSTRIARKSLTKEPSSFLKFALTLHPAIMKVDLEIDSEELTQVIQKASSRLREFYIKKSDG